MNIEAQMKLANFKSQFIKEMNCDNDRFIKVSEFLMDNNISFEIFDNGYYQDDSSEAIIGIHNMMDHILNIIMNNDKEIQINNEEDSSIIFISEADFISFNIEAL